MQVLVIAGLVEGISEERLAPLGKEEALRSWELYTAGRLRWVMSRTDKRGVVALFEAADLEEARKAVESLPMVKAGFITAEIIPLAPYVGFERLFAK
jgi:muconolactone delta-isomerase